MKGKTLVRLAVSILVLAGVLTLGKYLNAVNVRVAQVKSVTGTVEVQRARTTAWIKAEAGMRLNEGDMVRTKSKSKIVIELDDGSITQLTSLSQMKMEKLSRSLRGKSTDMGMDQGKSWMKVKKLDVARDKFNVNTPTAVAGVRGTYFSSEVEQASDSTFDVFEGQVNVSQKSDPTDQVEVRSNHRTEVKKGAQPTSPSQIPADQLKAALSEGIEGGLEPDNAGYDLKINVDPPTIPAGGRSIVTVQFMQGGKPFNGTVTFTLTASGSALFADNNAATIEVTSNEKGLAQVEVTDVNREDVTINADVAFEDQE